MGKLCLTKSQSKKAMKPLEPNIPLWGSVLNTSQPLTSVRSQTRRNSRKKQRMKQENQELFSRSWSGLLIQASGLFYCSHNDQWFMSSVFWEFLVSGVTDSSPDICIYNPNSWSVFLQENHWCLAFGSENNMWPNFLNSRRHRSWLFCCLIILIFLQELAAFCSHMSRRETVKFIREVEISTKTKQPDNWRIRIWSGICRGSVPIMCWYKCLVLW